MGRRLGRELPSPEWTGLTVNDWYRRSTTWDFESNAILSVSLTDLTTGNTSTIDTSQLGWYLFGGANSTANRPAAIRYGVLNDAGDVGAWDNLTIVPEPAGALLITLLASFVARAGRLRFAQAVRGRIHSRGPVTLLSG